MDNAACLTVYQPGFGNPSNSQFEGKKGWEKLFEDVGSRDAAVKPPRRGLRRSSKGFSQPEVTLKISNWELLPANPHRLTLGINLMLRYSYLFVLLLLNLQGCSNLPVALQNPPVPDLSYQDITMQPDRHLNRPVRWGGTILEVRNEEQYTHIEVLYYPLNSNGRPQSNTPTEGRFLIQSPRFLDPAVYQKDLDITVAGLFTGESEKKIGNKTLKIPIIQENTLYLWPKQQPQYYYWNEFGYGPYYSPFYFGYRPYRYYGYPYGRYYW